MTNGLRWQCWASVCRWRNVSFRRRRLSWSAWPLLQRPSPIFRSRSSSRLSLDRKTFFWSATLPPRVRLTAEGEEDCAWYFFSSCVCSFSSTLSPLSSITRLPLAESWFGVGSPSWRSLGLLSVGAEEKKEVHCWCVKNTKTCIILLYHAVFKVKNKKLKMIVLLL